MRQGGEPLPVLKLPREFAEDHFLNPRHLTVTDHSLVPDQIQIIGWRCFNMGWRDQRSVP